MGKKRILQNVRCGAVRHASVGSRPHPAVPLGVQRSRRLLQKGVRSLQRLVLARQLTEPQLRLLPGEALPNNRTVPHVTEIIL